MLNKETTPSRIVKYLDQYVIGQDEAKKIVSVAVYSHYRKISTVLQNSGSIAKSNVLLIGSSGTGKTLLCETLSHMLGVPFVTADATSLAQTKYVNEEIEAVLQRVLDKANGDLRQAQLGIVFNHGDAGNGIARGIIGKVHGFRRSGEFSKNCSGARRSHTLTNLHRVTRPLDSTNRLLLEIRVTWSRSACRFAYAAGGIPDRRDE